MIYMSFAASYCVKFNCTAQTVAKHPRRLSLSASFSRSLSLFLSLLFLHISESLLSAKVASWLPILSEVDVILM